MYLDVDADVFMICVAFNKYSTFESIDKWREEIQRVWPSKPIVLILTKSEFAKKLNETKDFKLAYFHLLEEKSQVGGFQGAFKTSSKVCEDLNVQ